MAVVGRIARAHGIRGQVVVNVETDFPRERFQAGEELFIKRPGASGIEPLIVSTVRFQHERPVLGFEGVDDMNAATALAGMELRVPSDRLQQLPADTFYWHDLVGCVVERIDGSPIGEVTAVEGAMGGSRLVVATERGEALVPFVREFCRSIDVSGKRIVVTPPEGLLELNTNAADRKSQE
jgi:16S rRNA processing protein RimM